MTSTKNVQAYSPLVGGGILVCPLSQNPQIPKNADEKLDSKFVEVGYIDSDGVTLEFDLGKDDGSYKMAWGGKNVKNLMSENTKTECRVNFKMLEFTSAAAMKLLYGSQNVSGEDGNLQVNAKISTERFAVVIAMVDVANKVKTLVVLENASLAGKSQVKFSTSEVTAPEVEFSCLPAEDGSLYRTFTAPLKAEDIVSDAVSEDVPEGDG